MFRHNLTDSNKSANLHIHEYSLILIFFFFGKNPLAKIHKKSENIAVLDLFVFYIQNIVGNLVSHFLEMIILTMDVCCFHY